MILLALRGGGDACQDFPLNAISADPFRTRRWRFAIEQLGGDVDIHEILCRPTR